MSASFIISIDSLELFNLPEPFLKQEDITSPLDSIRIKMTVLAGRSRRETFKSQPIPVSSLPLKGFGENNNNNNNINNNSSPVTSKILRFSSSLKNEVSHRFAEIQFTRRQEENPVVAAAGIKNVTSYETNKSIEFELRFYDKEGNRKFALISKNNFALRDAIKPGSFPEGIISPKIYFKIAMNGEGEANAGNNNNNNNDGEDAKSNTSAVSGSTTTATNVSSMPIAVLEGKWRRLHIGDSFEWVSNQDVENFGAAMNDDVSSFRGSAGSKSGKFDFEDGPNENEEDGSRKIIQEVTKVPSSHPENVSIEERQEVKNPSLPSTIKKSAADPTATAIKAKTKLLFPNTSSSSSSGGKRRVVIITGGSRGIGAALVKNFLLSGYLVSTCDILDFDHDELNQIKADALRMKHGMKGWKPNESRHGVVSFDGAAMHSEDNKNNKIDISDEKEEQEDPRFKILHTFRCDISNEEAVREFSKSTAKYFSDEKFFLCVINNAAIANPYMPTASSANNNIPLANIDIEAFRNFLNVNVTGSLIILKHFAKYLQPRKILPPGHDSDKVTTNCGSTNGNDDNNNDENENEINNNPTSRRDHKLCYSQLATSSQFKDDDLDREFFGGSIINISSTRASMSEPNSEGYAASKGAIESLTHAIAISNPRIRCNAIRLGWINATPGFEPSYDEHCFHPAGRVGRPVDVFEMCRFLAENDRSGFITGTVMALDGGVTRKMIYPE